MTLVLLFTGGPAITLPYHQRRNIRAGTNIMPGLFAARYNPARTTLEEMISHPANVGVRWALPGGLQRLELTVEAKSKYDAYDRYYAHQGQGFALLDYFMDRPIADGWAYEVIPDGRHVHYIIGATWKRHSDEYEDDNPASSSTDMATYLSNALTNHVPAASSDHSHLAATGTNAGDVYQVDETIGDKPEKIAEAIVRMGTSTAGELLDYWFVPAPLNGLLPQLPLPYLGARALSAPTWCVRRRDLRSLSMGRHIWQLENETQIWYTHTTTIDTNALEDDTSIVVASIATFGKGDEIAITLDNGRRHKTTINGTPSGSTIDLTDKLPDAAGAGNLVERLTPTATSAATDAASQARYWPRQYREYRRKFNQTQAEHYRDMRNAIYKEPVQQASFSIGSAWVRNGTGTRVPIWRMLINPGYIRIDDLFTEAQLFGADLDATRLFRIVSLDYDHDSRTMHVTPDSFEGDNRLDVLLQKLGLEIGQMVQKGA